MKRLLVLFVLLPAALPAQEPGLRQPDETPIVVPDLILQVEELPLESVKATLPSEGDLRLGELSLPLPQPGELQIDQAAFFLSAPESTPIPVRGSSVYSTGLLGAGSVNHVIGELSLFKLGEDPRFRLRFFYEGLDGFQFQPAGTGYFATENQVTGAIEGSSPDSEFSISAAFTERVQGLQGESPFYSAGLRSLQGSGSIVLRPDPLFELSGSVDARYAARLQSASNVGSTPRDQEFALAPGLGIALSIGQLTLESLIDYEFQTLSGERSARTQRIDAEAGASVAAASWLEFKALAGVYSEFSSQILYPWQLEATVIFSESLETELSGGFRVLPVSYLSLWREYQIIASGARAGGFSAVLTPSEWFGSARLRWSPIPGVTTTSRAEYVQRANAIELDGFVSAESHYEFSQRSLQTLTVGTVVSFSPNQQLSVQSSWDVYLVDRLTGTPLSSLGAQANLGSRDGRLSLSADAAFNFYPMPVVPKLDITGSFRITDGVDLDLVLDDILAPLLREGRPVVGPGLSPLFPFIRPGFRASVLTRISL